MPKEAQPQPIETHWVATCSGPDGVVPEGKTPGRNVDAVRYPDITTDVTCNNYEELQRCAINRDRCIFTRTPNEQLIPHTLSHIQHSPEASRRTVEHVLGIDASTATRVVNQLIGQGVVEEGGKIRAKTRPQISLHLTGKEPTTPYRFTAGIKKSK